MLDADPPILARNVPFRSGFATIVTHEARGCMVDLADAERGLTWSRVRALLTELDDTELAALVRTASEVGSGIGGRTRRLVVDGTTVFVKAVSLTALETSAAEQR
jgi:hypothetical protein